MIYCFLKVWLLTKVSVYAFPSEMSLKVSLTIGSSMAATRVSDCCMSRWRQPARSFMNTCHLLSAIHLIAIKGIWFLKVTHTHS
ncbi:hypothetical protein XENTR_v10022473 [Xenopus tropicalis]|nr:hypothetical protein XENTR_v10022473 [Xenopus tropicalis]